MQCQTCGRRYPDQSSLLVHWTAYRDHSPYGDTPLVRLPSYKCTHCHKIYNSVDEALIHLNSLGSRALAAYNPNRVLDALYDHELATHASEQESARKISNAKEQFEKTRIANANGSPPGKLKVGNNTYTVLLDNTEERTLLSALCHDMETLEGRNYMTAIVTEQEAEEVRRCYGCNGMIEVPR